MVDLPLGSKSRRAFFPGADLLPSVLYLARSTLWRRYCGSFLGFGWSILNPIVTIGIYFVVFRIFIRVPLENYFVYLVSGLLPWVFLNNSLLTSTSSLVSRREALHSSIANRLIFILADTTVELFTYAISLGIMLVLCVLFVEPPSWTWLALPLLGVPLIVFVYSVAVIVAYSAARYRDLPHLLQLLLNVLFWLMPIVYHWSMVPSPFDVFIKYNPISMLISPNQILIHGNVLPTAALIVADVGIAGAALLAAVAVHRRLRRDIIFYL